MSLKEDDLVLCTVKRIEGTTVFLDIEENGQGTMIFSEVSPGRIRNIRDFIAPNKKVVCKVLRMKAGHPELSLRRVTAGEREEILDRDKKTKILANMVMPVLKEKTRAVLEKIKAKYGLVEFLDETKENPGLINEFVTKTEAGLLKKIFAEKKDREKEVKKIIIMKSISSTGLKDIKSLLDTNKAEIHYLGSSKFSVTTRAKDFKKANQDLAHLLDELKIKAKKSNVFFEVKEK